LLCRYCASQNGKPAKPRGSAHTQLHGQEEQHLAAAPTEPGRELVPQQAQQRQQLQSQQLQARGTADVVCVREPGVWDARDVWRSSVCEGEEALPRLVELG
jgi:hypothetical protein